VPIVFSLLQCVLLLFTHETPKFLLQKKRRRAAERGYIDFKNLYIYISFLAIQWFRCETNNDIIQAEIHEMEADFQNIQTNATRVIIRT
jgi:hypothetical protein